MRCIIKLKLAEAASLQPIIDVEVQCKEQVNEIRLMQPVFLKELSTLVDEKDRALAIYQILRTKIKSVKLLQVTFCNNEMVQTAYDKTDFLTKSTIKQKKALTPSQNAIIMIDDFLLAAPVKEAVYNYYQSKKCKPTDIQWRLLLTEVQNFVKVEGVDKTLEVIRAATAAGWKKMVYKDNGSRDELFNTGHRSAVDK